MLALLEKLIKKGDRKLKTNWSADPGEQETTRKIHDTRATHACLGEHSSWRIRCHPANDASLAAKRLGAQ